MRIEHWRKAVILIEDAQTLLELDATYMPRFVSYDGFGAKAVVTEYPFFCALDNFDVIGGHFFERFE
jgi:hypothetical protein